MYLLDKSIFQKGPHMNSLDTTNFISSAESYALH